MVDFDPDYEPTTKFHDYNKNLCDLDDLLGSLLDTDDTTKEKRGHGKVNTKQIRDEIKDDANEMLTVMAKEEVESDVSDADVKKMVMDIAALDDLDADLFGESLLNKSGGRLPAHHRTETVTSASNSGMPDIPHGNAGSGLKQKPVTSSPVSNSLVDDRSMKDSFLKTVASQEDGFLFGSYQPSAVHPTAGNSRARSRRSVRFQDDDDIFGLDKPATPAESLVSGTSAVPNDMRWLVELTEGNGTDVSPESGYIANSIAISPAEVQSSTVRSITASSPDTSTIISATSQIGGLDFSSDVKETSTINVHGKKSNASIQHDDSKNRDLQQSPKASDWLGLKGASDSDEEFFIPKGKESSNSGISNSNESFQFGLSHEGEFLSMKTELSKNDDQDGDSFIVRAKARRQAVLSGAMENKSDFIQLDEDNNTSFQSNFAMHNAEKKSPIAPVVTGRWASNSLPGNYPKAHSTRGDGDCRDRDTVNSTHYSSHNESGGYGGVLHPAGSSLQGALIKLRAAEIEKQHSDSLLESLRQRFEGEIAAMDKSYKNRIQILEDSSTRSQASLQREMEHLMEGHLTKVKQLEQEKADIVAGGYRRLEEQEMKFSLDIESMKSRHKLTLKDLYCEHDESLKRIVEVKNREIMNVAFSHDTSRTLSATVQQIESNTHDLGQLQVKLDDWNRQGLDEREVLLRTKDEQLNALQSRLTRQEEDNHLEREKLQHFIASLGSQNREQLKQIEDERWSLKQEKSWMDSQQSSIESDRRNWEERCLRERLSLDKAWKSFHREQQVGLAQLASERRRLAEEHDKLNMDRKLLEERVRSIAVDQAKADAEYKVFRQAMLDGKEQTARHLEDIQRQADILTSDRQHCEDRAASLEREKSEVEMVASLLRQRSTELDALSEEVCCAREHGQKRQVEVQRWHDQLVERQAELDRLHENITACDHCMQEEKAKLVRDRKDVESVRQSGLCTECLAVVSDYSATSKQCDTATRVNPLSGKPVVNCLAPFPVLQHQLGYRHSAGVTVTSARCAKAAMSVVSDISIRLWKIYGIKFQTQWSLQAMATSSQVLLSFFHHHHFLSNWYYIDHVDKFYIHI